METTCPHEHKTLWQCLLYKKWSSETHDMPRLSRRSKTKQLSGTLFFRARFAPFCARFARFRARFAQNSWIIFDHFRRHQVQNVNITHVKADRMQGAILCFHRVYSPTLSCSHATGRRIFAMGVFHGQSHASNCIRHLHVVPWVSHVSNISQHVE